MYGGELEDGEGEEEEEELEEEEEGEDGEGEGEEEEEEQIRVANLPVIMAPAFVYLGLVREGVLIQHISVETGTHCPIHRFSKLINYLNNV